MSESSSNNPGSGSGGAKKKSTRLKPSSGSRPVKGVHRIHTGESARKSSSKTGSKGSSSSSTSTTKTKDRYVSGTYPGPKKKKKKSVINISGVGVKSSTGAKANKDGVSPRTTGSTRPVKYAPVASKVRASPGRRQSSKNRARASPKQRRSANNNVTVNVHSTSISISGDKGDITELLGSLNIAGISSPKAKIQQIEAAPSRGRTTRTAKRGKKKFVPTDAASSGADGDASESSIDTPRLQELEEKLTSQAEQLEAMGIDLSVFAGDQGKSNTIKKRPKNKRRGIAQFTSASPELDNIISPEKLDRPAERRSGHQQQSKNGRSSSEHRRLRARAPSPGAISASSSEGTSSSGDMSPHSLNSPKYPNSYMESPAAKKFSNVPPLDLGLDRVPIVSPRSMSGDQRFSDSNVTTPDPHRHVEVLGSARSAFSSVSDRSTSRPTSSGSMVSQSGDAIYDSDSDDSDGEYSSSSSTQISVKHHPQ